MTTTSEELGPLHQCDTCKFWSPVRFEYGTCRRYPPAVDHLQIMFAREMGYGDEASAGDSIGWWVQPTTDYDDWCGEYARRTVK